MLRAFVPYMIIIVVLGVCSLHAIAVQLDKATNAVTWPGLHVLNAKGKPPSSEIYKLNWLTAAGSQLFVCGLLTAAALRVAPRRALAIYAATFKELRWAIVTVCAVLGLAYVMNLSAMTITLGMWAAGAGGFFAFLSPIVGWFGTAVTGSDTSSNSLFGGLAGFRGPPRASVADPAGRRQQLGRRDGQDDLAPEPGDRSGGGRAGRPRGRHLP